MQVNPVLVEALKEYGGAPDGKIVVVGVDGLLDYSTTCGEVGKTNITPEFVDWLKGLEVTEAHLLLADTGEVQALVIDHELTDEEWDALYDDGSFFQDFSQGYSLRPEPFDGMTLFESE